jgi:hypothetical protein
MCGSDHQLSYLFYLEDACEISRRIAGEEKGSLLRPVLDILQEQGCMHFGDQGSFTWDLSMALCAAIMVRRDVHG